MTTLNQNQSHTHNITSNQPTTDMHFWENNDEGYAKYPWTWRNWAFRNAILEQEADPEAYKAKCNEQNAQLPHNTFKIEMNRLQLMMIASCIEQALKTNPNMNNIKDVYGESVCEILLSMFNDVIDDKDHHRDMLHGFTF